MTSWFVARGAAVLFATLLLVALGGCALGTEGSSGRHHDAGPGGLDGGVPREDGGPRCTGTAPVACMTSCSSIGTAPCVDGRVGACSPPEEQCDGIDQDCDGMIDEGIPPQTCSAACGGGTTQCVDGALTACMGTMPVPETCDGTDEDCDGSIDEGLVRGCTTACGAGTESCSAGVWSTCSAPAPAMETCDGRDEDCDGMVDEGSFTAYFAVAGGSSWRTRELSCASAFAPAAPVQTVFDIDGSQPRAYFLTATTYHVLDLGTLAWVATGARNEILPQMAGASISAAFTVPAQHGATTEVLYLFARSQVYIYSIDMMTTPPEFTFPPMLDGGRLNPVAWTLFAGTTTAYMSLTGTWGIDPRPMCALATAPAGPYTAYVNASQISFYDNGWCFDPIGIVPIASQPPFSFADAPPRTAWHHAIDNSGIWLFADVRLP